MPLKALSLYTGAGGLDFGFEAAGFDTCVAVEMDAAAVGTLGANRDWPLIPRSIHSVPSAEILGSAKLQVGDAHVLIGGPPCQPFSKSGYWARGDARRLADPRAGTLEAYLRVLADTQPAAFLLENVPGLNFSQKDEGLQFLRESVEQINRRVGTNYSFAVALLNAADFGVPQERHRVFVVGQRESIEFRFPDPTHGPAEPAQGELAPLEPYRTAWDAIGDLEEDQSSELRVTGKWAALLPSIPEGQNYLYHTPRGLGRPLFGWRRRYWSFLLKLAKDRPSWTIAAQPGPAIGPFHWRSRRLSRREMARLQTFPDDFEVTGPLRSAQAQFGNAVPSALAQVLALAMRQQFFPQVRAREPHPLLVPARRDDCPEPELVHPVPEKYLTHEGDHEPHPGTGKGYAAVARNS